MTALSVLAGAVCGVLSGFGIGGGSLLMIWMTAVLHTDIAAAQSINLLFFLPTAAASLIFHIRGKQVEWRAAVPAALSGVVTAAASAWFAASMDAQLLRRIFGGFLLFVGVSELLRKPSAREGGSGDSSA